MKLLATIGGDRKSEGSMHHSVSLRPAPNQERQPANREGLNNTSHVMTEALGMARIHIGSATWIKLVGFNLHLVLYVEQGGEIQNYTLQRVLKIYILDSVYLFL